MSDNKPRIIFRKIEPNGAEARIYQKHLHALGEEPVKPRKRFPMPEKAVMLVAESISPGKAPIPMGSAGIKPLYPGEETFTNLNEKTRYAEIKRMVVLPEFQGTGFAAELLGEIEKIGKEELGVECIVVETMPTRGQAIRFYTKNGYVGRGSYGVYEEEGSVCFEKWL